jgi:hypothetical protein
VPDVQRSQHVPSAEANMVDVDLDLACSQCGTGFVVIQGKFDWRRRIQGFCSNPECGDAEDTDKGSTVYIRVNRDGSFDRFESAPTPDHPAARQPMQRSQYRQHIEQQPQNQQPAKQ